MTLLTVISLLPAALARRQDLLVPKSKPTKMVFVLAADGRGLVALVATLTELAVFFSTVVVVIGMVLFYGLVDGWSSFRVARLTFAWTASRR